ncbi:MAG: hypothetical protein P0Y66_21945 [Candidatus Kaistia colombiensis]|nr:MAG: hypothetical protein P0Y66_21945 [Kaistia sp.]
MAGAPDAAFIAHMAEIAENLHRWEIGTIERAELVASWVRLTEERREVARNSDVPLPGQLDQATRKDGKRKGPQHMPFGISQAARELGVPRKSVERVLRNGL